MARNRSPRLLVALLGAACLALGGCWDDGEADNGSVTVRNRTDQTILVRYRTEYSDCACCGDCEDAYTWSEEHEVSIRAGRERTLEVESLLWDADIEVRYDGAWHTYDVDFDFWGEDDDIDVFAADFAPAAAG